MNIFKQIKNSVYGPEYYKDVVSNIRLRSSVKYLARFSLLIATLGVVIALIFLPTVSTKIKSAMESTVNSYPEDLEVTFKDGKASVNQPEPYMIAFPMGWKDIDTSEDSTPDNVVVINTKEEFSISKFREYSTMVLLTENEIVGLKSNNELRIIDIKDFEDTTIDKQMVLDGQAWLLKSLPTIFTTIIIVGFFVLFLANFLGTLSALFLYALAIWGMSAILKFGWTYKKSYQVGIHGITLVNLLGFLSVFGLAGMLNDFFVKIALLLIVIYFNVYKFAMKKDSQPNTVEVEAEEVK